VGPHRPARRTGPVEVAAAAVAGRLSGDAGLAGRRVAGQGVTEAASRRVPSGGGRLGRHLCGVIGVPRIASIAWRVLCLSRTPRSRHSASGSTTSSSGSLDRRSSAPSTSRRRGHRMTPTVPGVRTPHVRAHVHHHAGTQADGVPRPPAPTARLARRPNDGHRHRQRTSPRGSARPSHVAPAACAGARSVTAGRVERPA
jgi:hypothetical protein